jgi:hypothetical protein
MTAPQSFVIVGTGPVGAKAAEALRANGFDGCGLPGPDPTLVYHPAMPGN